MGKIKPMKEMALNIFTSLQEAISWVEEMKKEGCICPCCDQITKIYKFKLSSGNTYDLILLYRITKRKLNEEFFHVIEIGTRGGGGFASLSHWGLIQEKRKDPKDTSKRTSGFWKLTEKGKAFIENKIEVPSHIFIFDSLLLGVTDTNISVDVALGNKFNYTELMNEPIDLKS